MKLNAACLLVVLAMTLPIRASAQGVLISFEGNYPDGTPIHALDLVDDQYETLGIRVSTVAVVPGGLPPVGFGLPLPTVPIDPHARIINTIVAASPPQQLAANPYPYTSDLMIEFVEPCAPHAASTTDRFSVDLDQEAGTLGADPIIMYALDANDEIVAVTASNDDVMGPVGVATSMPIISKVVIDFTSLIGDNEGYDNFMFTLPACVPVVPATSEGHGVWLVVLLLVCGVVSVSGRGPRKARVVR